jgi:hypothetical protein
MIQNSTSFRFFVIMNPIIAGLATPGCATPDGDMIIHKDIMIDP